MNRQTTLAKNNDVARRWVVVDATDQALGRLSSRLAVMLLGKNRAEYTPHHDVGDYIVVTNVDKIRLTGKKADQKFFQTYSGYPGGQKRIGYDTMLKDKPELLLERAVRRMMPRNRLSRHMLDKLKMYRGSEHPHAAQAPVKVAV